MPWHQRRLRRAGAAGPTRTDDLTLTKRLLYQLSYNGLNEIDLQCGRAFYHKAHALDPGSYRR